MIAAGHDAAQDGSRTNSPPARGGRGGNGCQLDG